MVYDVILRLDEKKLPTLLQTIQGYAKLQNISVVINIEDKEPSKRATSFYTNGKRNKGIKGDELLMEIFSSEERAFTGAEIAKIFVERGFSAKSYSPCISRLKYANKVKQMGQSLFALTAVADKLKASKK